MEASRALSCLGNRVLPRPGRARPAYKNEPDALRHVKSVLFGGVANEPAPGPCKVPSASCRSKDAYDMVMLRLSRSDAAQTRRAACAGQAPYPEISQSTMRTCRMLQERCALEEPLRAAGPQARAARQRYPQARAPGFRDKSLHGAGFLPAGEKTLASASRSLYTPVTQRSAFDAFRFGILLQQAVGQPTRKPDRPEQPKRLVGV